MRALAFIGMLLVAIGVVMGAYFFGGYYSVAASDDDSGALVWALTRVREASIARHATGTPKIPVGDAAAVQAGARNYAKYGCANCHGGPGVGWSKFSEGLNPGPPDLKEAAKNDPSQIFWVVKNGIRMTGMPSFGKAGAKDDEIAQIAAFIRKLPSVSDADYKTWTATP